MLLLPLVVVLCSLCRKEAQDLDSAALKELFPFGHCNLEPAKNYCTHQAQQLHCRRLLTKKVKCQVHPHKKRGHEPKMFADRTGQQFILEMTSSFNSKSFLLKDFFEVLLNQIVHKFDFILALNQRGF